MMANSKSLFILALFLLGILCSCERELDLELNFESHLVVNSTFSPGETWIAQVTKSGNVLDSNDNIDILNDAFVTVRNMVTNDLIELTYRPNGLYMSNEMLPEEGVDYELMVQHKDYTSILAMDRITHNATITDLDTMTVLVNGQSALEIQFNIKDNNQENNYYIWDLIYEIPEDSTEAVGNIAVDYVLESSDGNTEDIENNSRDNVATKIFITDILFNGSNHNTSFISITSSNDGAEEKEEGEEGTGSCTNETKPIIKLRIQSVSKNLYDYYKSIEVYQARENIKSNSSRPSEIYSNVKNGFGIFGGVNEQVIEF